MSSVDLEAKIPNNVGLRANKRLTMALEKWQPKFLDWWKTVGPSDFNEDQIYLRTAVGVGQGGWRVASCFARLATLVVVHVGASGAR